MIKHMTFMRSLEVKTLCLEGSFINKEGMYIVFSGQCEEYKTRKDFLPQISKADQEELLLELDSGVPKNINALEDFNTASPAKSPTKSPKKSGLSPSRAYQSRLSHKFSSISLTRRKSKYLGEDQMQFAEIKQG